MRYMGLDYGLKRVGVAMTDPDGTLAWPHSVITWERRDELFEKLFSIIHGEKVESIVVGLPLGLDGKDTETTRIVRNFVERLQRRTELPVHLHDERFTSWEAEEAMKEAGVSWKKRKKQLDSLAAQRILDGYLSHLSLNGTPRSRC